MSKFVSGDHNVICDTCGLQYKRSETRLNWKRLLQCEECYDVKHPQLLVRGRIDHISVDIARPESYNDDDLTFGEGSADDL